MRKSMQKNTNILITVMSCITVLVMIAVTVVVLTSHGNGYVSPAVTDSVNARVNSAGQVFVSFQLREPFKFEEIEFFKKPFFTDIGFVGNRELAAFEYWNYKYEDAYENLMNGTREQRREAGLIIENDIVIAVYKIIDGKKVTQPGWGSVGKNRLWSGYLNVQGTAGSSLFGDQVDPRPATQFSNGGLELCTGIIYETASVTFADIPDEWFADVIFVIDGEVVVHTVRGE
ncbi:MAG: hypothetical protein FWE01_03430 [Firmicutes bacterium]|nr:hypothetical protein [Bacillota bacterium]